MIIDFIIWLLAEVIGEWIRSLFSKIKAKLFRVKQVRDDSETKKSMEP
ncbi:Uncharacterised protein [Legionella spiritensis]|nr:Uncharacterised protein [Legionella spiritensis]